MPLITSRCAEQKRSKPSWPVKTYFASRTLFVFLSIVNLEIRASTPGGWPGKVRPSSWFMSTV